MCLLGDDVKNFKLCGIKFSNHSILSSILSSKAAQGRIFKISFHGLMQTFISLSHKLGVGSVAALHYFTCTDSVKFSLIFLFL